MPQTETWTQAEIVRAVLGFGETLQRIETKLDKRPSWDDINRITDNQLRVDEKQDEALKAVEDDVRETNGNVKALEDKGFRLLLLGGGALVTGATSIVLDLIAR